jgi:hypothetical protein
MSSMDTTLQFNPDNQPPWHKLSSQQLRQAGLNISDIQQRKIDKSLTRLSAALKTAGLNWTEDPSHIDDADTTEQDKETFETYLATYR